MIVPTLEEFEKTLFSISQESAALTVSNIYNEAKNKGYVSKDGQMNGVSGTGSCVMYLDMRKPLYKFFTGIQYDPQKFYFVFISDREVHINLRNLGDGQSYTLSRAAYDVVKRRLIEVYGWEVYNTVNID